MATFKDLVKQQRSRGSGVFTSLGTAIGQKSLEKMDPRNYLFNRSGLMTSLFPGLKGYQAGKTGASSKQIEKAIMPTPVLDKENSDKFSRIDSNTRLTAKNSMVLPMMARDMNLMRQNMHKLVRINSRGREVGTTKADMFFKRSADREKAYESKFKKDRSIFGTTKTPTETGTKDSGKGFFGSLFGGILGGLGSIAGGILSIGGSIIGGIASMIGGVGGAIFRTIGMGLSFLGPIGILLAAGAGFLIYQLSKSINFDGLKDSFKSVFGMKDGEPSLLERLSDRIKESLGIDKNKNLAGEIAKSLDETFKTNFFKDALLTITTAFGRMQIYTMSFYEKAKIIFLDMLEEVKHMGAGVLAAMLGFAMGKQLPGMIPLPGGSGGGGGPARDPKTGRFVKGSSGMLRGMGRIAGAAGRIAGRGLLAFLGPVGMAIAAGWTAYEIWGVANQIGEDEFLEELRELLRNGNITKEEYDAILQAKDLDTKIRPIENELKQKFNHIMNLEDQLASDKRELNTTRDDSRKQVLKSNINAIEDQIKTVRNEYSTLERQFESLDREKETLNSRFKVTEGVTDNNRKSLVDVQLKAVDQRTDEQIKALESSTRNSLFGPSTSTTKVLTTNTKWSELSEEQKNALLDAQAKWEGFTKPGTLPNRMNNPGAMLYKPWQKKFGAEPGDSNSAGVFAKFPTVEQGRAAQRSLWDSYYKDMPLDQAIRTWTGTTDKPQESANYLAALFSAAKVAGVEKEVTIAKSPEKQQKQEDKKPSVFSLAALKIEDMFSGGITGLPRKLSEILSSPDMPPIFKTLGSELAQLSTSIESEKNQAPIINVDNSQTNNNVNGNQQPIQISDASGVADIDFMAILMGRSASGVLDLRSTG